MSSKKPKFWEEKSNNSNNSIQRIVNNMDFDNIHLDYGHNPSEMNNKNIAL